MKHSYLCPGHKEWLTSESDRLDYYWLSWLDASEFYLESGQIEQAIPYLGAAFELAESALSSYPDTQKAISRFMQSSFLLGIAYGQMGDTHCRDSLYRYTEFRLDQENDYKTRQQLFTCDHDQLFAEIQ
ncbi:hypothetical protein [Candidatus Sororendozoicomonas aggregata]|uniref:hypothetical protein n=1 Tax=Candidatus Sororendozoicomonas aggregata TaxID=3073239 RepID=UPI002ED13C9A